MTWCPRTSIRSRRLPRLSNGVRRAHVTEGTMAERSLVAPWGAWTGRSVGLAVPDAWQIIELSMRDAPAMTAGEIDRALDRPVDLAGGHGRCVAHAQLND